MEKDNTYSNDLSSNKKRKLTEENPNRTQISASSNVSSNVASNVLSNVSSNVLSNVLSNASDEEDLPDIDPTHEIHANQAIQLVFYENDITKPFAFKPTFTHQLFPDEVITELSNPQNTQITINVSLNNLKHYLNFSENLASMERNVIKNQIALALPDDTIDMGSVSFESYSPYRLRSSLRRNGSDGVSVEQSNETQVPHGGSEGRNGWKTRLLQGSKQPPGVCLHSFSTCGNNFEIWRVTYNDKGAAALLSRAEKIAIWFIETADGVDFSDDRWEALFLYRVKDRVHDDGTVGDDTANDDEDNEDQSEDEGSSDDVPNDDDDTASQQYRPNRSSEYYFIGYFTLFTFRNFIVGCKLRICQALILPHYQGMGLGREMILQVYRLARERPEVKEVAVEYPAPAFEALKDVSDCDWAMIVHDELEACQAHSIVGSDVISAEGAAATGDDVLRLFHGDAGSCAHNLKLTSPQSYFVLEALRYCALPSTKPAKSGLVDENKKMIEFRTEVKRRLLRENPELKSLPKPRKFQKLEDLFQEQLQRYIAVRKYRAKHKQM